MAKISMTQEFDTRKRVAELVRNIRELSKTGGEVDFSAMAYVTPLSLLPVAVLLSKAPWSKATLAFPPSVESYLQTVGFPKGIDLTRKSFRGETYLPITQIDLSTAAQQQALIDQVVGHYEHLLLKKIFPQGIQKQMDVRDALSYFITELSTNVHEHAKASTFSLLAQYWAKTEQLEICLVDDGIGIRGAYTAAGIATDDDRDAVKQAVIHGISVKDPSTSYSGRGKGLGSSAKLVTESALAGEFTLITGDACYLKLGSRPAYLYKLPVKWQGVIIAIKVKRPSEKVDYLRFVE